MKNYRQIANQKNLISWGGGLSQSKDASDIYDIEYVSGSMTYIVPENGVLFYIGIELDFSVFPKGFENLVLRNISFERKTPVDIHQQASVIKKKKVVKDEVLGFSLGNLSGTLILCEEGSALIDYYLDIKTIDEISNNIIFDTSGFYGLGHLSYILSNSDTRLIENNETRLEYAILSNYMGNRGNGIYPYKKEVSVYFSRAFNIKQDIILMVSKIGKYSSDVKSLEPLGITITSNYHMDFNTTGVKTYIAPRDGYIVFCGAYRGGDIDLLNDFTILQSIAWKPPSATNVQTIFIAIRKVIRNEVINFIPTASFGGDIYLTDSDLSNREYSWGHGSIDSGNENVDFSNPRKSKIKFGIISQVYNEYAFSTQNSNLVHFIDGSGERVISFCAVDYLKYIADYISFDYKRIGTPTAGNEIKTLWIEFS